MRSTFFATLGVALAITGLVLLAGCTKPQAQTAAPPPAEVTVIEVPPKPVALFNDYVAQTQAPDTVEIRAQVTGLLQRQAFGTQGATDSALFGAKVSNAARKTKPTWYVVAANDHMIQPDLERKFAKDVNAKTTTLASSHVVMLSHPTDVAKVTIDAARNAAAR